MTIPLERWISSLSLKKKRRLIRPVSIGRSILAWIFITHRIFFSFLSHEEKRKDNPTRPIIKPFERIAYSNSKWGNPSYKYHISLRTIITVYYRVCCSQVHMTTARFSSSQYFYFDWLPKCIHPTIWRKWRVFSWVCFVCVASGVRWPAPTHRSILSTELFSWRYSPASTRYLCASILPF